MLRIFQIGMGCPDEQPGGLNRYFFDLLNALSPAEVNVEAFVTGEKRDFSRNGHRVHVYSPTRAPLLKRWSRLAQALNNASQSAKPDLIVNHFAPYGLIGNAHGWWRGIPRVTHFQGPWSFESAIEKSSPRPDVSKKAIESLAYAGSRKFIVLSHAFKAVLREKYGISPQKIEVIPPGIDTGAFRPGSPAAAREKLGWPAESLILVSVRRLMKRMGLDLAIQAMSVLKNSGRPFRYFIGGVGPEENHLRELIQKLSLQNHVTLLGKIPSETLPLVYQAADLSLVPTRDWEGFGLVAAESLACGTPCLVSSSGGLPEIVTGINPDFILPGLDPESIARHVLMFAESRARMAPQDLAEYARENFHWPVSGAKVLTVYRQTASGI